MKVLIKRNMFLGGILYEPNAAGTVLPDEIDGRKVVLYDHANPPKARGNARTLFELDPDQRTLRHVPSEKLEDKDDKQKDVIILPVDVVAWSDEAAKEHVPQGVPLIKGHPKLGEQVPLSALTPGLSKAEQEAAIKKDLPKTLAAKADQEKELLDSSVVGKK